MVDLVAIERVREQVRLETTDTTQDGYLRLLTQAAIRSVENETGHSVMGDEQTLAEADLDVVSVAVLLLVGSWFANRESVTIGQAGAELPLGVKHLLMPLKRWTV